MASQADPSTEERILRLLQHLGIEQAHFAARSVTDWGGLANAHPEVIASLTIVCPMGLDAGALQNLGSRLLVFNGDQGPAAEATQRVVRGLPEATLITLQSYASPLWADAITDRGEVIGSTMMDFLGKMSLGQGQREAALPEGEGEVAGISYRISGDGPPLVLLPLYLAPSQWEPLLPELAKRFRTITLGGAELGAVATMEGRAHGGYLGVMRTLMDEAQLLPGDTVLDVGCGSGVLDRWLAHHTGGANSIVGLDINLYMLREARSLAH